MLDFAIPTKQNVSEDNKALFDNLEKVIGFVPNMYAVFALSPSALGDYLKLQNRKNSLTGKEREAINLVVSELNGCDYCRAAHTAVGKLVGFSEEQLLEIRSTAISFSQKLSALVRLTKEIVTNRGDVSQETKERFFKEGYTTENLVDTVMTVGDKIITNYLFAIVKVPIDFPEPPSIQRHL